MPRNSKIAKFYREALDLSGDVIFTKEMTVGIFKISEADLAEILRCFSDDR